jgi:hypothetical protein
MRYQMNLSFACNVGRVCNILRFGPSSIVPFRHQNYDIWKKLPELGHRTEKSVIAQGKFTMGSSKPIVLTILFIGHTET